MQRVDMKAWKRKGQTTMMILVFMMLLFVGIGALLFSLAETVSQEDYMDLYVNNLLLSVMRTDTGYDDMNCKKISDLIACSFVMPDWICGDSGIRCKDMVNDKLSDYIGAFETISQNYRYVMKVSSQGFVAIDPIEGTPIELIFGDEELPDLQVTKRTANYAIQKRLGGSNYNLKVSLSIAKKGSE